ncbi:hypothetical protein [Streptomyces sp. NPDC088246]|uniref:hypothetical protein n=1 Tax=Streptomyces sp. NPDC088246 TaxID=3365842 RepID=UPI003823EBAC
MPEPAPSPGAWVPAALAAIGVVLALTVCAVVGLVVHECPALREPVTAVFGAITALGLVAAFVVSLTRRR